LALRLAQLQKVLRSSNPTGYKRPDRHSHCDSWLLLKPSLHFAESNHIQKIIKVELTHADGRP
jgi:hypothetical protein